MASDPKSSAPNRALKYGTPEELLAAAERWACEQLGLAGSAVEATRQRLTSIAVETADDSELRRRALGVLNTLVPALETLADNAENPYLRTWQEQLGEAKQHLESLQRGLAAIPPPGRGKHRLEPRTALVAHAGPMPDGRGGVRFRNYTTKDGVVAMSILAGLLTKPDIRHLLQDHVDGMTVDAAIAYERKRIDGAVRRLMAVWGDRADEVRILEPEPAEERNS